MDRVLLVGSERITSLELASSLEDAGFAVEAVYSGYGALSAIDRVAPRFLVTNLHLGPGPDGLEVARYASARRPDILIVLTSGRPAWVPGAADGAIAQFIAKPFRSEQIVAAFRRPAPVYWKP